VGGAELELFFCTVPCTFELLPNGIELCKPAFPWRGFRGVWGVVVLLKTKNKKKLIKQKTKRLSVPNGQAVRLNVPNEISINDEKASQAEREPPWIRQGEGTWEAEVRSGR